MSSDLLNASTASLQSSTTVTSTSPLNNTKAPAKDYSAAFATLQSRYGTGGHVPTPKPDKSKISVPQISSSNTTLTSNTTVMVPTSEPKSSEPIPGPTKKRKGLFQTLKGRVKGSS